MSEKLTTYPYPTRPGVSVEALDLTFGNENALSAEVRQEVIDFEHGLYELSLDSVHFPRANTYQLHRDGEGVPLQSIECVWRKKVNKVTLGVNYFLTEAGREYLSQATGRRLEGASSHEIECQLANLDITGVSSQVLDELQANSIGYEEERLTGLFVDSNYKGAELPSPDITTVYKNPHVILEKAKGYRDIKLYIRNVMADLRNESIHMNSEAGSAKMLMAELYRRRINRLLASTYVEAFKLLGQYRTSNGAMHAEIIGELEDVLPALSSKREDADIAGTLQRLDRFSHGVGIDENGQFTWLSSSASELSKRAGHESIDAVEVGRGVYSAIDVDVLGDTQIEGRVFGLWIESVLEAYSLLSEHRQWDSEREGYAPDGKWQVIVDDKYKSLAVNSKQGVIKVPAKSTSIMAAVTVGSHEITHVIQAENKRVIGELKILENGINLDVASEQSESGGKWQEREARQVLTGRIDHDIPGTGYVKAIAVKARGGSYGECVEAYHEDLLRRNPKMTPIKAAAMAVNRARRIFRSGGFEFAQGIPYLTNTQPLSYIEQQLIYEELGEFQRKLLFIGGITVRNLVRLAEKGLVDPQKIFIPATPPWEIMYPHVKKLIASIERQGQPS